jgi:hypothetical protein
MYGKSIALALPIADPADYAEIENIMRDEILHSNLDWVPTGLFRDTAQLAYEVLLAMRAQPIGSTETPGKLRVRK